MRYDCIEVFITDGTPCAEKVARTVWMGGKPGDNFSKGYLSILFDVKQTNAKEIGAFQELNYRGKAVEIDADLLKKIANRITEKYKIQVDFIKDPTCTAGGWYNPCDNKIAVNLSSCKNNSHRLGTLMHELGHARTLDDCQNSRKLLIRR